MSAAEKAAGQTDGGVEAPAEVRVLTAANGVTVTFTRQADLTPRVCVCVFVSHRIHQLLLQPILIGVQIQVLIQIQT